MVAERVWRPAAAVCNRGPGGLCAAGPGLQGWDGEAHAADPAVAPDTRGAGFRPKTATVERREASAPIARCAPRLTRAAP